jgi:hypothetical protein
MGSRGWNWLKLWANRGENIFGLGVIGAARERQCEPRRFVHE